MIPFAGFAVRPMAVVAAAAAAAALLVIGWLALANAGLRAERDSARLEIAELRTAHAEAVAKAANEALERERKLQAAADAARGEADAAIAQARAAEAQIVRVTVDRDRLRRDAASLREHVAAASSAAGRSQESLAACQGRAERLGAALADGNDLLAEGIELVAEGAGALRVAALDADTRGAKLTACLRGWPQ